MGEPRPAVAPWLLLAAVTAVQLLATFSVLALPTLAPRAAETFGVGAEAVGYQLSIIYVFASVLSSFSGLYVRRWGGVTTSIIALLASALGLVFLASGSVAGAIIASIAMGASYALTNPAASHLLMRFGPKGRQSLVFAVKQAGVPLGGMLAALCLPPLATAIGWQQAMLASIVVFVVVALLLLPWRARLDADAEPAARVRGALLAGARTAMANPTLRALAVMGCCYASFQFCLMSFAISMLVADLGWSLVSAGLIVAAMQGGGALGRIGWSLVADSTGRGIEVLLVIGVVSCVLALGLGRVDGGWSVTMLVGLLMALALCAIGWNGVYMSEVARAVPAAEVGLATGGVLVFNFAGVTLGPSLFAVTYKLVGSYAVTYAVFAVLPVIGAVAIAQILVTRRRSSETAPRPPL